MTAAGRCERAGADHDVGPNLSGPCRRRLRPWLLACLLPGCVVVEERPAPSAPLVAAPIAIPFAVGDVGSGPRPHDLYYESVISQMQRAWLDHDREHLARLLDAHERKDAPGWARESMVGFRRTLTVMQFEEAVADRGTLDLPAPLPGLGEPLRLTIRLGPLPSLAVRLLGGDAPARARFLLAFRMFDRDVFGTEVRNTKSLVVDLPAAIDFAAGQALEVPVSVDVQSGGAVLRRLEFEVFLMPGHVEIEGVTLPNRRVRCAHGACELLPLGHDRIAAQPLLSLRAALRLGDAAHFPHVYLAARQLAERGSPKETTSATALLVDRLRLGSAGQARNAMAALSVLRPDGAAEAADRAGWLRWWGRTGSPLR